MSDKKLRLGILGLSPGNGHPYSWSAIFNGYDEEEMARCPFPSIPEYLAKQPFPDNFLVNAGEVTHIWTQDSEISEQVAAAAKIKCLVKSAEEMIGEVDAVLLARDDAENHLAMAKPFLEAGLPIFIDKPFAISVKDATAMVDAQKNGNQIFTCSSLRFAEELLLTRTEKAELGEISYAEGIIGKKWETYGIHILEPIVAQLPARGKIMGITAEKHNGVHIVTVKWENCLAVLKVMGDLPVGVSLNFFGTNGKVTKHFTDSFSCFKASLQHFVDFVNTGENSISREEIFELVTILEKGIIRKPD